MQGRLRERGERKRRGENEVEREGGEIGWEREWGEVLSVFEAPSSVSLCCSITKG